VSFRVTLTDLQRLSKVFDDAKHRAAGGLSATAELLVSVGLSESISAETKLLTERC